MAFSTEQHPLVGTTLPLKGIRRAAARQMTAAWQAPAFHLSVEVDMTRALDVKSVHPGATVTDLLVAVCAKALVEHPDLNAHYSDDGVTTFDEVNIGIAVSTEAGLTVPNIHGAQALTIGGIAEVRREVVERARARKLSMGDVTGGTFTISNLGMFGIDAFSAVINPPQACILAVGKGERKLVLPPIASYADVAPGARAPAAAVATVMTVQLSSDARVVDAGVAGAFLQTFRAYCENPALLTA